jgi:hypothetical protein
MQQQQQAQGQQQQQQQLVPECECISTEALRSSCCSMFLPGGVFLVCFWLVRLTTNRSAHFCTRSNVSKSCVMQLV